MLGGWQSKITLFMFLYVTFSSSVFAVFNPPQIIKQRTVKSFGRDECSQLSFQLDYQRSEDPIDHCNVYLNGKFLKTYPECQDKANTVPLLLNNLLDQTKYVVQIQAVDGQGRESRLSLPYFAQTKKCTQPSDIQLGVFLLNFADFKNTRPWSPTSFENNYFVQENYWDEALNLQTWFDHVSYKKLKVSHRILGSFDLPFERNQYCSFSHQSLGYDCDLPKIIADFKELALQKNLSLKFDRKILVISGIGVIQEAVDDYLFMSAHSTYWDAYHLPVLSYAGLIRELGYALGLSHNGAFYGNCSYPVSLTELDTCFAGPHYGSSIMGEDGRGFNSEERRMLGFISNQQVLSVSDTTQPFVAKIANINSKSTRDIKQIRIRRELPGFYADTFFFLDYRFEDSLYATADAYGRSMTSGVYVSLRRSVLNTTEREAMIFDVEEPLTLDSPELYMTEHRIYLKLLEVTPEYAKVLVAKNPDLIHINGVSEYSGLPSDQSALGLETLADL